MKKKKELTDVYQMPYVEQTNHFVEFLYWLKAGKHKGEQEIKITDLQTMEPATHT